MADLKSKITENLVGYVITAVVGALLAIVLRSSGNDARFDALQQQVVANSAAVRDIQKSLADGGPAPLAKRVDDLATRIETFGTKIDKMYEIVITLRR